MNYNTLDLFCGAGGLSLGFEMAGFNILAGIDIEKPFLKSFDKAHPNSIAINEDLNNKEAKEFLATHNLNIEDINIVIGGPPCQGFSTAGNRMIDDPRNSLVREYSRLIEEIKPTMFLMENVSGLASMKNGLGELVVEELLDCFDKIGYYTKYKILLAADYGVPQLRNRMFFVGCNKDVDISFKWPKPTHFPEGSLMNFGDNAAYLTVNDAISDLPKIESGAESTEYESPPSNNYQKWARNGNKVLTNHKSPKHSDLVIDRIKNIPQGGNHGNLPEHLKLKSGYPNIYGKLKSNSPADTITGNYGCASAPGRFLHPTANRVLTVREGARIQSFPDRIEILGSMTQQYKQVGNAVPPLLAKAVAKEMKKALERL